MYFIEGNVVYYLFFSTHIDILHENSCHAFHQIRYTFIRGNLKYPILTFQSLIKVKISYRYLYNIQDIPI